MPTQPAPPLPRRLSSAQKVMARDMLAMLARRGTATMDIIRQNLRREPNEIAAVLEALERSDPPFLEQVGRNGPYRLAQAGKGWVEELAQQGGTNEPDPVDVAIRVAQALSALERERDEALAAHEKELAARTTDVADAARMLAEAEEARQRVQERLDAACEAISHKMEAERDKLRVLLRKPAA